MEAADLDRRLSALETRLDEMQHAQRMQASAATRRFEADLAQLRQDITGLTGRMALSSELQELRKAVESGDGGHGKTGEPGWHEAAELVPRLMSELARLREEVQSHRPGGTMESDLATLREGFGAVQEQLAPLLPLRADVDGLRKSLRALDERLGPVEALRSEVAGLAPKLEGVGTLQSRLEALEGGAPALEGRFHDMERAVLGRLDAVLTDLGGLGARLDTLEGSQTGVQSWLEEVDTRRAALQTRLEALESMGSRVETVEKGDALAALERRVDELAKARPREEGAVPAGPAPAGADPAELTALRERLAALEARPAGDPALKKRLESLESRPAGDPGLQKRLEALESRLVAERPAVGNGVAGGEVMEALSRRLDALEASDAALLTLRVESIELGLGVERERVREVFGDLLAEHGLMLRSLESRLGLLLQDVHRLGEEVRKAAADRAPSGS